MTAIILFTLLAAGFGALLAWAAYRFHIEGNPIVDQIDTLLPQTQCGQCGYPGCRPYAEAIAADEADINLCAPGGETVVIALSELTGKEAKPVEAEVTKFRSLVTSCDGRNGVSRWGTSCPTQIIIKSARHSTNSFSGQTHYSVKPTHWPIFRTTS